MEWEAIHVEDESAKVQAVQPSWKVTIVEGVWINGRLGKTRACGCLGWGGGGAGILKGKGIDGGVGGDGVKGRAASSGGGVRANGREGVFDGVEFGGTQGRLTGGRVGGCGGEGGCGRVGFGAKKRVQVIDGAKRVELEED